MFGYAFVRTTDGLYVYLMEKDTLSEYRRVAMWVIPVFCENGSMEPKFTFAALGGLVNESVNY